MKDWVMGMEIEIEFPDYDSVQSLTAQMAQTDWRWEYSVHNSGGDRAVVKITGITVYESFNDLRKMMKNVLKGE